MTSKALDSLDEYEKRELIAGNEVMLSPPPSTEHRSVQGNISGSIWNYLRGKRCKVFSETLVVFDEKNRLIPDILVVCDKSKIKHTHIEGAPDFVVEILSPSTRKYDLGMKKDVYEKYGVKEYWIVDPTAQTVETYILTEGKFILDNSYHNYGKDDWDFLSEKEKSEINLTLKISLYPELELNVKEIFEG